MKIDLQISEDDCHITFYLKEFGGPKDYLHALNIIEALSGEFDIDPEMSEADVRMLAEEAEKSGHSDFSVEITEDGVEALA